MFRFISSMILLAALPLANGIPLRLTDSHAKQLSPESTWPEVRARKL